MFLDVKELAVRKIRIRKSYAPGTVDFHTGESQQVDPLDVRPMAGAIAAACARTVAPTSIAKSAVARRMEPTREWHPWRASSRTGSKSNRNPYVKPIECPQTSRGSFEEFVCQTQSGVIPRLARIS